MNSALSFWTEKLTKLRTDKVSRPWPSWTKHQAPHKPLLLLSVMDLYAMDAVSNDIIEPSMELVEIFKGYWDRVIPDGGTTSVAFPLPRLERDGIWQLIPREELEGDIPISAISSMVKLKSVCSGARVDNELYRLLMNEQSREILRAAVITHFFSPEMKAVLLEESEVQIEAEIYSKNLLRQIELKRKLEESHKTTKVRSRGFSKAILPLYGYRCAICGIKITTPEEYHVIEAAHIVPWSVTRNDDLTNGLSLCRLCHWSFDRGMLGIDKNHQVLVSRHLKSADNCAGHLLTLEKRPIFQPKEPSFAPGIDNLAWHRKKVFIR